MKAIIYAAGRGVRLGAEQPKILLEIGGRTLLGWHALRLSEVGINELVIVTGYQREKIVRELSAIRQEFGFEIREIVNERFHEGSVLSFLVSLPEIEKWNEPLLLMDADVLYPTEMLRRLLECPHRTALLVDREFSTDDDDPVLVPVKDGRPFDFRKRWSGEADFVGESIGFFKVALDELPTLIDETRRRSAGPDCGDSYDDVLRALVVAGRFGCCEVTDIPWTEIDFPEDETRAREVVLPAIHRLS